jgi:hypothetical protein
MRQDSLIAMEALQQQLEDRPRLEALQTRLADLSQEVTSIGSATAKALKAHLQDIASWQEEQRISELKVSEEEVPESWQEALVSNSQLQSDYSDLYRRFDAMQAVVDEQVLVSLQTMQRQLPEAMAKVDRLLTDENERFSKVEENDVRLCAALTKLESYEQKVRDCMHRLDQVPSASHARAIWQEELQKLLPEINVDGLSKRLDMSLDAIDELHRHQQKHAIELRSLAKRVSDDEARIEYEIAEAALPLQLQTHPTQ